MQAGPGSELASGLSNRDPERDATRHRRLSRSTLWIITCSLALGFATWCLVSAIAPRLTPIGSEPPTEQVCWLVALPYLARGLLRFGWMVPPPITGRHGPTWCLSGTGLTWSYCARRGAEAKS